MTEPKEMFLPGSRHEWTAMVAPPDGYRLDSAIGTTYCLDFIALTAVLRASLNQHSDRLDWEDRAQLLLAITKLGERVRVLVNRGQIHAGVSPSNELFALFDRMVTEVRHDNGNFHPKVWALKYTARRALDSDERSGRGSTSPSADAVYRLICTSRNLTKAQTWEAVVRLEGSIVREGEPPSIEIGRSLGAFFKRAVEGGEPLPASLRALVKELANVSFSTEGSKALRSCDFFWQWPGRPGLDELLETGGTTALMVSPFVSASFIDQLKRKFVNVILVSRQEELDALPRPLVRQLPPGNLWVVKASDGGDEADNVPALELHAKILLCEYPNRAGAKSRIENWIGSANATGSAWGIPPNSMWMNCEAMMRFSPAIRPQQFLDQFAYRTKRDSSGEGERVLNGWVEQYESRLMENPTAEQEAEKTLEHVSKEMSALLLRARFTVLKGVSLVMTLDVPDPESWTLLFEKHPELRCTVCPMSLSGDWPFRDLTVVLGEGTVFQDMTLSQAGAFILIQLTHVPTNCMKQFVVKAITEMDAEFWERRRVAFLKDHLTATDFRAFLQSILFGGAFRAEFTSGSERLGNPVQPGAEKPPPSLFDDFTIEDILQSCTEDKSRIEEIDRLLDAFASTEHVDPSFRQFWTNFRGAIASFGE